MEQTNQRREREMGFTLMELMIVIAIIGILVGAGVFTWRNAVRRGNETAAAQTLDTIRKVQADYALGHRGEYGTFDQLIQDGSLDERFAGEAPVVQGYVFTMRVVPRSANQQAFYSVNADPIEGAGSNHFYIDPNISTVRINPDAPASATDLPLTQ